MREQSRVGHTRSRACARCLKSPNGQQCVIRQHLLVTSLLRSPSISDMPGSPGSCSYSIPLHSLPPMSPCPSSQPLPPPLEPMPGRLPPETLTRGVSSVLLNSGPLAVEGVVGRAFKALRADARSPAAGSGVAESGQRRRGARGGAEAEHCVVCVGVSGEWWECAYLELFQCWSRTFARLLASEQAGVPEANLMTAHRCDESFAGRGDTSASVHPIFRLSQHLMELSKSLIDACAWKSKKSLQLAAL